MIIRKLEAGDKSAVLDMMKGFYASPALLHHAPEGVLIKDIEDCLAGSPYIECYVAESDGKIAGYTMLSKGYSTECGGISVMIEDLFVKEEFRGRKIGEKFLRFAEEKYRGVAVRLRLEVEPSNLGAIRLYERCGFTDLPYKQMCKEL